VLGIPCQSGCAPLVLDSLDFIILCLHDKHARCLRRNRLTVERGEVGLGHGRSLAHVALCQWRAVEDALHVHGAFVGFLVLLGVAGRLGAFEGGCQRGFGIVVAGGAFGLIKQSTV
jgi:hypothetical protein